MSSPSEEKELLPCPFCNSKELSILRNSEFDCWSVYCDKCNGSISKSDCHLPDVSYDELEVDIDQIEEDAMDYYLEGKIKGLEPLIKKWNTRPSPPSGLVPLDEEKVYRWLNSCPECQPFYEVGPLGETHTFKDKEFAKALCAKFSPKPLEVKDVEWDVEQLQRTIYNKIYHGDCKPPSGKEMGAWLECGYVAKAIIANTEGILNLKRKD